MDTLTPTRDRVLIRPVDEDKQTRGGILLPDSVKREKKYEGEVLAVGPGRPDKDGNKIPMSVKKGDIVLYDKYGAIGFKWLGEELVMVPEKLLLAIVEEQEVASDI